MPDRFVILSPLLLLPIVWLLRFIGCTPFGGSDSTAPAAGGTSGGASGGTSGGTGGSSGGTAGPSHTVELAPATAVLNLWGTGIGFTATVDGAASTAIDWSFTPPNAPVTLTPSGVLTYDGPPVPGVTSVTVTATSKSYPTVSPGKASVTLIGNGASFVKLGIPTKGDWNGVYGSAGWVLPYPPDPIKIPAYFPGLKAVLSWTVGPVDPTADQRGLLSPPAFASRFASTWVAPPDLSVEFSDSQPHQCAIYCVDWDTTPTRVQTVEVWDESQVPPAKLYSRDLSAFSGGQYLVLKLGGTVTLRIFLAPGQDPGQTVELNGIFFD